MGTGSPGPNAAAGCIIKISSSDAAGRKLATRNEFLRVASIGSAFYPCLSLAEGDAVKGPTGGVGLFIHKGQDNRTNIPKRDTDGSDQSSHSTL